MLLDLDSWIRIFLRIHDPVIQTLADPTDPDPKHWFKMPILLEGIGNVSEAAEFNFHADPEAASIVLRLTRCPTYIASWELCLKYTSINMKWRSEVSCILE